MTRYLDPPSSGIAADTSWGWSDQLLFDQALASLARERPGKAIKLVITLSSHAPFEFVQNGFVAGDDLRSRYLNSMNYLDQHLGRFVGKLQGRHLMLVWGDHESGALGRTAAQTEEFVPGFIALVGGGRTSPVALSASESELLSGKFEIASLYSLLRTIVESGRAPVAWDRPLVPPGASPYKQSDVVGNSR